MLYSSVNFQTFFSHVAGWIPGSLGWQGVGVGLRWPKVALLRVIRKSEIQGQNQNRIPGTLSSEKSQAEAASPYTSGNRMKPS